MLVNQLSGVAVRHRSEPTSDKPRKTGFGSWLREITIILVSALLLSLIIKTFLVQAFFIPSGSMEHTLEIGDRVLVTKLAPGPLSVHRGDIVVFKDPGGWLPPTVKPQVNPVRQGLNNALTFVGILPQDSGEHLIKRIIGVPGDKVECCTAQGQVTVNGVAITEPYLSPGVHPSEIPFKITVPQNYLWVMGDNRQHSGDSRYHLGDPGGGAVPMSNVVGVSFMRIWPFDRSGVLHNPGDTFRDVPAPK